MSQSYPIAFETLVQELDGAAVLAMATKTAPVMAGMLALALVALFVAPLCSR